MPAETISRPDQSTEDSFRHMPLTFEATPMPELPADAVRGDDGASLEQAAADARREAQSAGNDYVYPNPRGEDIVLQHPSEKPVVTTESNSLDDSHAERIKRMRDAVAQEREARATEEQQRQGMSWHGQTVVGTRDFVEKYGWDADLANQDKWELIG